MIFFFLIWQLSFFFLFFPLFFCFVSRWHLVSICYILFSFRGLAVPTIPVIRTENWILPNYKMKQFGSSACDKAPRLITCSNGGSNILLIVNTNVNMFFFNVWSIYTMLLPPSFLCLDIWRFFICSYCFKLTFITLLPTGIYMLLSKTKRVRSYDR